MSRGLIALAALIPLVAAVGAEPLDRIPNPRARDGTWVTDMPGKLSPETVARLNATIGEFERTNGAEMAVVVIRSLDGLPIEEAAVKLFELWGIGKKGKDNGLLLLWSTDDRRVRVEVGYGLEGVLNDGKVGAILDAYVIPRFRSGEFDEGVLAGVDALLSAAREEPLELPSQRSESYDDDSPVIETMLLGLLGLLPISVGSLVMVIMVVIALEQRMFFLGQNLTQAVSYHGQVSEGLAELLSPHEIVDRPGARPLRVSKARIRFEKLDFSYKNARVFDGCFNLEVAGGEKVGLVGHSGAGKSTLVSLLLRQFELDGGRITIDGQSVSEITLESLRRNVALVPQSTSLFHRTILENIRYGRLDACDAEVIEAARLAEADSFIRLLPQGYDTKVGERGVKLSGGQRQRIAIARALLRQAPILLLDEATSALDSESEAAIQAALVGLMRDKTVIAIAHRLSTLRAMDRIVVVEQGRIVEDGSHEALVRHGGTYASLWNSQVSGFIPD